MCSIQLPLTAIRGKEKETFNEFITAGNQGYDFKNIFAEKFGEKFFNLYALPTSV
jgi:hypothetical protein